ncbi:MAG: DM13 domain-containing protein [Erythrobacter sp.]
MRAFLLLISHGVMLVVGFGLGVYFLPILTAPEGPGEAALSAPAESAMFSADLTRDLKGSDRLHWGEGSISLTPTQIVHMGKLAPGPDYMVYLVADFVEDEDGFNAVKAASLNVGSVKTFDGFILDLPAGVDLGAYTTVLVWCEAFGEFITAAKYR